MPPSRRPRRKLTREELLDAEYRDSVSRARGLSDGSRERWMSERAPRGGTPRWARAYRIALVLVIETVAALLGLYTMFKAVSDPVQRPWLYAAAIGMMGIPAAHSLEAVVSFLASLQEAVKEVGRRRERDEEGNQRSRRREDEL